MNNLKKGFDAMGNLRIVNAGVYSVTAEAGSKLPANCAYIDENAQPGITEKLRAMDAGVLTPAFRVSNHACYPMMRFHQRFIDALEEM